MKPGYKQTEVGVIPEEWEVESYGNLCIKIQDGTHFSPTIRGNDFDFLYVTSKNIRFGYLDISTADRIDATQHEIIYKRCSVQYGDLLLTKDGANTGNAALNSLTEPFSLLSSVAFLRFDPKKHSASYFLQQCLSNDGQQRIKDAMSGNAITRLTLEKIRKLKFPVPPLPEQRAIAAALSDVDALLAGLERLIAKKRDLKQAAMQQLLTGQTRLPGFDGAWEVKRLGELFNFSGGYSASRDQLSTEGHCYLHYGDIHGSTKMCIDTNADFQNIPKLDILLKRVSPASLLDDGDIVFVDASEDDAGTSKHVVVVNKDKKPFISGLHTIVAKSKTDELAHEFRRYCFQTPAIRQQFLFYSVGTKVSGISKRNIPKLTLSFPPLPEQTAIAAVLSDMDAELAALETQLHKTRAIKQGMMQELLTGRTRLIARGDAENAE
jgi:type I restriction enzyme S subunit